MGMRPSECVPGTDYAIAESVYGWGRFRGTIKGTFVKVDGQAGRFRLADGSKAQRSYRGIRETWASHETQCAEALKRKEEREASEAETALRVLSVMAPVKEALGDAIEVSHHLRYYPTGCTVVTITIPLDQAHRLARFFHR